MDKHLTVPQGAALTVGAVLGTGVIGLPSIANRIAGPASILAWLALVLLSIPLAATFAALGARHPDTGGVATYVRRAFGDRASAVVGWSFFFAVPVGAPAAALFAGRYVAHAFGGGTSTELVTCAGLLIAVCASNAAGLHISGRLQLALGGLLVALILVATIVALPHADPAHLRPFAPHGWLAVGRAASALVWSFAGWEATTSLAADFRSPKRDLPRVTVIAVVVVGVLYLGVAGAGILVLGPADQAPLADLLAVGTGGPARLLAAVAALLLTFGTMNAYFAGAARLGTALARDGALPSWLAPKTREKPESHSTTSNSDTTGDGGVDSDTGGEAVGHPGATSAVDPAGARPSSTRRSLAVVGFLAAVATVAVGVTGLGPAPLVLLTTGCFVVVYVLGTAAAVRLLPRRSWARRAAWVALVCSLGLLALCGWYLLWPLAIAAAALSYLRVRRRSAPDPQVDLDTPVGASGRPGSGSRDD